MKIPLSGEKPKNLIDLVSNGTEAVKISTKSRAASAGSGETTTTAQPSDVYNQKATSIKLGISKYLSEELDPVKVSEERKAKVAALKAQFESGTYLTSINQEEVAKKLLEESQLENFIVGKAANSD